MRRRARNAIAALPAPDRPVVVWPPMPPAPIQSLRLISTVTSDPVPFEVAIDHRTTFVWSGTTNGPAVHSGDLVNDALESLATVALRINADGLYSVRLSTAVDHGWMYVTATATATLPALAPLASRHGRPS